MQSQTTAPPKRASSHAGWSESINERPAINDQTQNLAFPRERNDTRVIAFRSCRSSRRLESIFRLRYDIYVNELGVSPSSVDHTLKRLADAFDDSALHICVHAGTEVIAAVRMHIGAIPPVLAVPLSLERFPFVRSETSCLISKLVVHPQYRRSTVTARLLRSVVHAIRENDVTAVFCTTFPHLTTLYERLGFKAYKGPYLDPELGPHFAMIAVCAEAFELDSRVMRFLARSDQSFRL